ncbi:hypothetical protein ACN38_g4031 [Penicillium nordicum]|uniref:Uncharacterized protein n=1 Tax=Penicillium nordicum TaxID=229535 RepID=A0A0M8P441_9EURO|nr:hypothetical protein ACN38_g4031 [Penicillium nordicum]
MNDIGERISGKGSASKREKEATWSPSFVDFFFFLPAERTIRVQLDRSIFTYVTPLCPSDLSVANEIPQSVEMSQKVGLSEGTNVPRLLRHPSSTNNMGKLAL